MVKMLTVKNFGEFGELQAIRQSFFCQFSQLSIELRMASDETYGLLLMVVYSLLAYRHQAYSTVVTIGCISITN